MADSVSDAGVKPLPKRRRILPPSAIVPVPVYSSKVSSSLQLKPQNAVFTEQEVTDDDADEASWSRFSSRGPAAAAAPVALSDSEDDEAEPTKTKPEPEAVRCPSPPPPPESPVQKQSRRVRQKISRVDRKLQTLMQTPEPPRRRTRGQRAPASPDDDDVIIISPAGGAEGSPYSSLVREIPLKIRCRTDVHKIPVLSSTLLSDVVSQLSVSLDVPPPRLLLLRDAVELPTDASVGELGLGIADIIECVVMAAEDAGGGDSSRITVRLQSKDRDASLEFSLRRDAPLGSIFSQYLSTMAPGAQKAARFHFDGSKVTHGQTPAELDMEDGDIIEVWT